MTTSLIPQPTNLQTLTQWLRQTTQPQPTPHRRTISSINRGQTRLTQQATLTLNQSTLTLEPGATLKLDPHTIPPEALTGGYPQQKTLTTTGQIPNTPAGTWTTIATITTTTPTQNNNHILASGQIYTLTNTQTQPQQLKPQIRILINNTPHPPTPLATHTTSQRHHYTATTTQTQTSPGPNHTIKLQLQLNGYPAPTSQLDHTKTQINLYATITWTT